MRSCRRGGREAGAEEGVSSPGSVVARRESREMPRAECSVLLYHPAQRRGDQSGSGQVREHLVEECLSVGKRKPLGMAQELFPRGGLESGTQAGLILFGESDSASVEV